YQAARKMSVREIMPPSCNSHGGRFPGTRPAKDAVQRYSPAAGGQGKDTSGQHYAPRSSALDVGEHFLMPRASDRCSGIPHFLLPLFGCLAGCQVLTRLSVFGENNEGR